jgi:hypothetical protein
MLPAPDGALASEEADGWGGVLLAIGLLAFVVWYCATHPARPFPAAV